MELKGLAPQEIVRLLQATLAELEALYPTLTDEQLARPAHHDGWTVQEIIGHLYDTEQVWGGRIARTLREERPLLPGYDPDGILRDRDYNQRHLPDVLREFRRLRERTLALLAEGEWERVGLHAEEGAFTVRMLAETLALHEEEHVGKIKEVTM